MASLINKAACRASKDGKVYLFTVCLYQGVSDAQHLSINVFVPGCFNCGVGHTRFGVGHSQFGSATRLGKGDELACLIRLPRTENFDLTPETLKLSP